MSSMSLHLLAATCWSAGAIFPYIWSPSAYHADKYLKSKLSASSCECLSAHNRYSSFGQSSDANSKQSYRLSYEILSDAGA